jgi:ABC-type sugar transport system substrate-binding protein
MKNHNSRATVVAAAVLLFAAAGASQSQAAGETIGYSSPFLFSQFQVILQDQTAKEAEAAGFKMLSPTNADGDSGKQITDIRSLIGAGAEGLIVVANDKGDHPGARFRRGAESAGSLDRHRA